MCVCVCVCVKSSVYFVNLAQMLLTVFSLMTMHLCSEKMSESEKEAYFKEKKEKQKTKMKEKMKQKMKEMRQVR